MMYLVAARIVSCFWFFGKEESVLSYCRELGCQYPLNNTLWTKVRIYTIEWTTFIAQG